MIVKHKWFKDEDENWLVECVENNKRFSPKCNDFKERGACPICGGDAETEMSLRKRVRAEEQRRREMSVGS